MQKEEVIKKIDELSVLLLQMKKILRDYEDIISKYSDNDLKYSYNDCEYWESILANSRQNILNHLEESENTDFDNEIAEALRLAGVQLNEAVQVGRYKYKTVSDLMNDLQKCDPEAVVIVSEKWGRGAAQFHIRTGYTDTNYLEVIGSQEPTEEYPTKAIEISAAM